MRKRAERDEEGFTLIELMVVVLIIAILLAIAIPTFLGARKRANDRAAQSSLRNAATAAKTMFTDAQTFATATEDATTGLPTVEGSLTYVATASPSIDTGTIPSYKVVSVRAVVSATVNEWYAAALSKSGTCFYIKESSSGSTQYSTGATCTATAASAAGVTWVGSWS